MEPIDGHLKANEAARPSKRKPIYRQLWFWVIVGMVAGVVLGVLDRKLAIAMQPLGTGFIKLIAMTIGPLIFCTMISGVARMASVARLGAIALKSAIVFQGATCMAMLIAFLVMDILRPGEGFNLTMLWGNHGDITHYAASTGRLQLVPFVMNIIPDSFVGAFTQGNMLQVVLLSIISGIAIIAMGEKAKPLTAVIDSALEMIFGVIRIIMLASPIGAFGAMAYSIGKFGLESTLPLGTFIGEFYLACLLILGAIAVPVTTMCRCSILSMIRYFRDEILLCVATTSSEVVLPRIIDKLERLGCDSSVAGVVMPAGMTFNPLGSGTYLIMVILFLAQAIGKPLSIEQQFELFLLVNFTARAAVGVAGAGFVALVGTVGMWGPVPVAVTGLMLGIHRLLAQAFAPLFAFGNALSTLAVARWERLLDLKRMKSVLESRGADVELA